MSVFWMIAAFASVYLLGCGKGQAQERDREERAFKKAEENIVYLKDRR
jgi:hypothetical protein